MRTNHQVKERRFSVLQTTAPAAVTIVDTPGVIYADVHHFSAGPLLDVYRSVHIRPDGYPFAPVAEYLRSNRHVEIISEEFDDAEMIGGRAVRTFYQIQQA